MKRGRGAASTEETHCDSTHTSDMHSHKQKQIKRKDFERHADYGLLVEIIIHAESNLRKHLFLVVYVTSKLLPLHTLLQKHYI